MQRYSIFIQMNKTGICGQIKSIRWNWNRIKTKKEKKINTTLFKFLGMPLLNNSSTKIILKLQYYSILKHLLKKKITSIVYLLSRWKHMYASYIFLLSLRLGLFTLPKCVRFPNFELFWVAEIILNQSYFNHFFLNDCLEVANLI